MFFLLIYIEEMEDLVIRQVTNNNVDLASQGGLVIFKGRTNGGNADFFDTERRWY